MPFEPLVHPFGNPTGDRLISELMVGGWDQLRCAVAFAKLSGVQYLDEPLRAFAASGGKASISVGVDHDGTSFEAVSQLLGAVGPNGNVFVVKHVGSPSPTFHPKAFLFTENDQQGQLKRAVLISGSTNLTEGGLFTNYEFASAWMPDLADRLQAAALNEVVEALDTWADPTSGLCLQLDEKELVDLNRLGWLPTENAIAGKRVSSGSSGARTTTAPVPAGLRKQQRPPKVPHSKNMGPPTVALPNAPTRQRARRTHSRTGAAGVNATRGTTAARSAVTTLAHSAFVIDISTGTRLTEVFLSKTALGEDPAFFGHPFGGLTSPRSATAAPQPELQPRPVVDILLIGANGKRLSTYQEHEIKIWEYVNGPSANMDVRMIIPQELLRNLPEGCILEMRRTPIRAGLDYVLTFLAPGSPQWTAARAAATKALPGGKRSYGWM